MSLDEILAPPEPVAFRDRLTQLYTDYTRTITGGDLTAWPDFFTDDCLYQVTTRENVERGLPLPLLQCEGRAMAMDRARAIVQMQVFQPRRTRYYLSGLEPLGRRGPVVLARADFLVVQAIVNATPNVISFGEYRDEIVCAGDRWRFRRKICVLDNDVVTTSLVYPL